MQARVEDKNAAARTRRVIVSVGAVVGEGHTGQGHRVAARVVVVDATAVSVGIVAADGAVRNGQRGEVLDAAAEVGGVAADGAARHRQRSGVVVDAAATADGVIAAYRAIRQGDRAVVVIDAASSARA